MPIQHQPRIGGGEEPAQKVAAKEVGWIVGGPGLRLKGLLEIDGDQDPKGEDNT